jgi:energy-converting hydrogenase Eha subunit G
MYTQILLNVLLTVFTIFAIGACGLAFYIFWREIKEGNI